MSSIEPYGGKLVNLVLPEEEAESLKKEAINYPDIFLNERQLCDLELLASGAFSPLNRFMGKKDYESVLKKMRLQNGILWPIPICLDVSEKIAKELKIGQYVGLRDQEGFLLAVMKIEEIWMPDKGKEAIKVYGTSDKRHPGVEYLFEKTGKYYITGEIKVTSLPLHFDFKQLRLTPLELRAFMKRLGWKRIVGFQTENPVHRAQYEMTIRAMHQAKANLLLLPIAGIAKPGDFDHYTRVRCYKRMAHYYPPESFMINLLPLAMRMAGPREAILHAIIARNYGCTHFIIGHNHASPEHEFYLPDEATKMAKIYEEEIGINIIPFEEMVYVPDEEEYRPKSEIPEGVKYFSITGSEIRRRIKKGKSIPEWATFPEVIEELQKSYPPPKKQGFTIFMTGLSGAGKSTIAKVLYAKFMEMGERPVTLLDGDIVRKHLSSELGFSKEHRDINIRRIGFVAREITKNRGIAICAPIAPYAATRAEVRRMIEEYGGFIEVHVATPLEVCEKRDRKGLYAKARAGLIKGFTGIDDPYEPPASPEVRIDTTNLAPEEAANEILLFLEKEGYI